MDLYFVDVCVNGNDWSGEWLATLAIGRNGEETAEYGEADLSRAGS